MYTIGGVRCLNWGGVAVESPSKTIRLGLDSLAFLFVVGLSIVGGYPPRDAMANSDPRFLAPILMFFGATLWVVTWKYFISGRAEPLLTFPFIAKAETDVIDAAWTKDGGRGALEARSSVYFVDMPEQRRK